MSYLLDTNVVSELRKRSEVVDPQVLAWSRGRPVDALYISVVTIPEAENAGVPAVEVRKLAHRGALQTYGKGVYVHRDVPRVWP